MRNSRKFLILFFVFSIVLDLVIGKVYETLYFSEKSKRRDRLIHSAVGANEEILVFGSSRAYHHYNPLIIQEETGLSCYNVGCGGQNIYYHLALLKAVLENSKPKKVILDVISIDYEVTGSKYNKEKLGVLLPFVNESKPLRKAVLSRSKSERFKLLSSIYPFNSKQLHIVRNNLMSSRSDVLGFVGLNKTWHKDIEYGIPTIVEIDSSKYDAFVEFIELCANNEIGLWLVFSPHYVDKAGANEHELFIDHIYHNTGVTVLDFTSDTSYIGYKNFFADPYHLNHQGADKLSQEVGEIINLSSERDN